MPNTVNPLYGRTLTNKGTVNLKKVRNLFSAEYMPYKVMAVVSTVFLVLAFVMDHPNDVFGGFMRIIQSRSILFTDYVAIGGIGAALLNVSIVGFVTVISFIIKGIKPCGANIMAFWLTIGFSFFGKNVFNMIPLTFGVWLYAKFRKSSFAEHYIAALLVATLSPAISEIAFLGMFNRVLEIIVGILLGFLIGFIFPIMSYLSIRMHSGFNLYNMGFAGGLIAMIIASIMKNMGLNIVRGNHWSTGNNFFFAVLLYSFSGLMFIAELLSDLAAKKTIQMIKRDIKEFVKIHEHSGKLSTDFYNLHGKSVYVNMAVLCSFATTVVLVLGADLNGPTIAGILTMTGFGSFGKHIKNVAPVVAGAIAAVYLNRWEPAAPPNILAILFSSGLAPIAGAFGPVWGIIAGFLHVNIAGFIGDINGGLNLYNNGFAASFVAMFLLPIINIFKPDLYSYHMHHR